ncbi:MAG: hypothetical protein DHS20C10_01520 [marine bacterium B5-7]|nr:MAG: hypothetical protein DHS20C10_01520 [marine bacterium B5-7]
MITGITKSVIHLAAKLDSWWEEWLARQQKKLKAELLWSALDTAASSFLYLVKSLSTIAVTTYIGLLAFVGVLNLSPANSILFPLAVTAFLASALIDGEVYKQTVFGGVKKMFGIDYMRRTVLMNKFHDYLEEQLAAGEENELTKRGLKYLSDITKKTRIKEQIALLERLKRVDRKHRNAIKKLLETKKQALEALKKVLKKKENEIYFDLCKKEKQGGDEWSSKSGGKWGFSEDLRTKWQREANIKKWVNRAFIFVHLGAGAAAAIATIFTLNNFVGALSIKFGFVVSAGLMSGLVWPMAIFTALGYTYYMYHTVADIIANDKIQRWGRMLVKSIKDYHFREDELKSNWKYAKWAWRYIMPKLFVIGVLALLFLMTIATAGTSWAYMKDGADLLANWGRFVLVLRLVTFPLEVMADFIFNGANTIESAEELLNSGFSLKKYFIRIWQAIKENYQQETRLQFLNPFRFLCELIESPFKVVVFIVHCISASVGSDGSSLVKQSIAISSSALIEGTSEMHFMTHFEEVNSIDNKEKSNEKAQLALSNHRSADHNHSHDIPSKVCDVLLIITLLKPLAALWDYASCDDAKRDTETPWYRFYQSHHWNKQKHSNGFSLKDHGMEIGADGNPYKLWKNTAASSTDTDGRDEIEMTETHSTPIKTQPLLNIAEQGPDKLENHLFPVKAVAPFATS